MKKRYARILAATLSAAMVFTSAPASVFDTGVIEAKAEAIAGKYNDADAVKTAYGSLSATVAANGLGVDTDTVKNVVKTAMQVKAPDVVVNSLSTTSDATISPSPTSVVYEANVTYPTNCTDAKDDNDDKSCDTCAAAMPGHTVTGNITITVSVSGTAQAITAGDDIADVTSDVSKVVYDIPFDASSTIAALVDGKSTGIEEAIKEANSYVDSVAIGAMDASPFTDKATKEKIDQKITLPVTLTLKANAGKWADGDTATTSIQIRITKKPSSASGLVLPPATAKYYYGSGSADLNVLRDSANPATTPLALQGFTPANLDALVNASVSATPIDLTVTKKVTDADQYDYSDIEGFDQKDTITKTIKVTVIVDDRTDSKADLLKEALKLLDDERVTKTKVTYGTDDVKLDLDDSVKTALGSTKLDDEVVIAEVSSLVAKTDAGNYAADKNFVTLKLKKTYAKDDYGVKTILDTAANKLGTTYDNQTGNKNIITYNEKTGEISIQVPVTIEQAEILASKIEWPTKTADGSAIKAGTELAKVVLEKTASSIYGDFRIDTSKALIANSKMTSFDVLFKPNKNTKVKKDDYRITQVGTEYKKEGQLKVTVEKNVIADDDCLLTSNIEKEDIKFGITYENFKDSLENQNAGCTYSYLKADGTVIPVGSQEFQYRVTIKDTTDTTFADGTTTKLVTVPVTVPAPKMKPVVAGSHVVTIGKPSAITQGWDIDKDSLYKDADKDAIIAGMIDTIKTTSLADSKMQWYKDGVALYGQVYDFLTIDASKMSKGTYSYDITPSYTDNADKTYKDAVVAALGTATVTAEGFDVTVSNSSITIEEPLANPTYGEVKDTIVAKVVPGDGYTVESVTWSLMDKDTKEKIQIAASDASYSSATNKAVMSIPADIQAGKYIVYCEVATKSEKAGADVATQQYDCLVVNKATKYPNELKVTDADKLVAKADRTFEYGQKIGDIKVTPVAGSEKFGTYEWKKPEEILLKGDDQTIQLVFIPNKFSKKNYTIEKTEIDVKVNVKARTLVVTAEDLVITAGEKVDLTKAVAKANTVGNDTLAKLGIDVDFELASTVDTTKVGTYEKALKVTVKLPSDWTADLAKNYANNIVTTEGNVIVKAAAPVVTPTPTPAPVKQATAAAPKAAKAKATVKVGKKYTLKLKYASAAAKKNVKKVTWKSSKKSVATVSSKGKVTAKKAGKATIAATITFKDGSKKKVKFKVTVK